MQSIGKVDIIVADPPDNIGRKYDEHDDALVRSVYLSNMRGWLHKCCQLCDGPVFWIFNERWIREVELIIHEEGIPLVQRLWWYWTFGQHQKGRLLLA